MQPLEQIRAVAERVAASHGLEIWDIQSRREAIGHVVRVFIDRPGPAATPEESVSVEDCAQVNREMSTILDVEDPLPFATRWRCRPPGSIVRCATPATTGGLLGGSRRWWSAKRSTNQKAFEGRLRGVEDEAVLLEAANGRIHRLPLRLIARRPFGSGILECKTR